MDDVKGQVRSKLNILDLANELWPGQLKRAGHRWKMCCPFHTENSASFMINEERQTATCFGACADTWDIFGLYMKAKDYHFQDALEELAGRAGVEYKRMSQEDSQTRDALLNIHVLAAAWYHEKLRFNIPVARDYLIKERGLTPDSIRTWQLGYAPDAWNELTTYLLGIDYEEKYLLESGLCLRSEKSGRLYDRFRHRVMFPIFDPDGRIVAFGGRDIDNPKRQVTYRPDRDGKPVEAKYINSPETPIFKKNLMLYGLHAARDFAKDGVVIVEGYMDVIGLYQAGFKNAIAGMGIALNAGHADLIAKFTRQATLCLDPDDAGKDATRRSIPALQSARKGAMDLRVMTLHDERDPDELALAEPDVWRQAVEGAIPGIDWLIDVATRNLKPDASLVDRENVAKEIVPIVALATHDVVRRDNFNKLAMKLRMDAEDLRRYAGRAPIPETEIGSEKIEAEDGVEWLYIASLLRAIPEVGHCNLYPLTNRALNRHKAEFVRLADFHDPYMRNAFDVIIQGLNEIDQEPYEYIHERLPVELFEQLESLPGITAEQFVRLSVRLKLRSLNAYNKELFGLEEYAQQYADNRAKIHQLSMLVNSDKMLLDESSKRK